MPPTSTAMRWRISRIVNTIGRAELIVPMESSKCLRELSCVPIGRTEDLQTSGRFSFFYPILGYNSSPIKFVESILVCDSMIR